MKTVEWMLIAAVIAALSLSVTACRTLRGAGQDIENAGEALEEAAE
jgi:predicted small secreted protein